VYNRNMPKLIMFTRTMNCSDQVAVRSCLAALNVQPIERNISTDMAAAETLIEWVGSLAVPTLAVIDELEQPIVPPRILQPGQRTRNTDRGSLISEPSCESLQAFLLKHGFITDHDHTSYN
jgi:hypothetical protein